MFEILHEKDFAINHCSMVRVHVPYLITINVINMPSVFFVQKKGVVGRVRKREEFVDS